MLEMRRRCGVLQMTIVLIIIFIFIVVGMMTDAF